MTVVDGITGTTLSYGYDGVRMVASVNFGAGRARTFQRDNLDRVSSDTLRNSANQTVASVAYKYDADDRLSRKTTTGTGANTYGYDLSGRLASRTTDGATTEYGWDDGFNRVITRSGQQFSYPGPGNEAALDGIATYPRGPGDELLATAQGTDERLAHRRPRDMVGDFNLADIALSVLADSVAFDPFGQVVASSGPALQRGSPGRLDRADQRSGQGGCQLVQRRYRPSTPATPSTTPSSSQYSRTATSTAPSRRALEWRLGTKPGRHW